MEALLPVLGVVLGVYLASLLAYTLLLGMGLAVAGKSLGPRAGYCMAGVIVAGSLLFAVGVGVVFWALGPIGLGHPVRVGITAGYAGLAVLSSLGLAFASAVAFNR